MLESTTSEPNLCRMTLTRMHVQVMIHPSCAVVRPSLSQAVTLLSEQPPSTLLSILPSTLVDPESSNSGYCGCRSPTQYRPGYVHVVPPTLSQPGVTAAHAVHAMSWNIPRGVPLWRMMSACGGGRCSYRSSLRPPMRPPMRTPMRPPMRPPMRQWHPKQPVPAAVAPTPSIVQPLHYSRIAPVND